MIISVAPSTERVGYCAEQHLEPACRNAVRLGGLDLDAPVLVDRGERLAGALDLVARCCAMLLLGLLPRGRA